VIHGGHWFKLINQYSNPFNIIYMYFNLLWLILLKLKCHNYVFFIFIITISVMILCFFLLPRPNI
jgi:hypothetical protein